MDIKKLIEAAKEINENFGLEPAIVVTKKATEASLLEGLKEAAEEFRTNDEFSKETIKTLKSLKLWPPVEKEEEEDDEDINLPGAEEDDEDEDDDEDQEEEEEEESKPVQKSSKKNAVPAPEPESEPESEPEEEEEDKSVGTPYFSELIKTVKGSSKVDLPSRIALLKKVVKANPTIFPSLVKIVASKFDADDIRAKMLETLLKAEGKSIVSKGPKGAMVVDDLKEKPAKETKTKKTEKGTEVKKEKIKKASRAGGPTKKSVIEEMTATKKGATIEEMAKAIVERGIDDDYLKNCTVTKLWLAKMGFDIKKASIAKDPYFKK